MKNGGWLDAYDDVPQAENGIEGTMGGLTDKGFNYNGAWGGTMAMGGSMPGAVGFTYARTGSIPSNGPYAKKTKASAQDGRAISDNTRLKPIVTEKPMNRETVSSSNDSYVMSPQEALLNKLKGVRLKESQDKLSKTLEKVTAVGSLSPNPFISVPSGIVNFTLGVTDAPTPGDAGLDYMGLLGSVATPSSLRGFKKIGNRIPFFKGLSFIDAGSDIFEFTPSEDLPKKQNGGEMKYYQEGLDWKPRNISQEGSKTPKKRTLVLAEHNPEFWDNPDGSPATNINPFIKEAAGIKSYVNKYFPGEDVEVIPTYKQNIKEALAKSDPNTRLVVMGHSGNRMFGIPTTEFIESVGNTKYENCYAGICYGDILEGIGKRNPDKELIGKMIPGRFPESYNLNNFNIRSNEKQWVGFAPVDRGGEEGFRDSFFRRTKNPELNKLEKELKVIWANNKADFDEKVKSSKPIEDKINRVYSQNKQIINLPKAADTKELDYIPIPARTANYGKDPLRFNPQALLQNRRDGGEIPQAQFGTMLAPITGEDVSRFFDLFSVPQKAVTKLVTGKYQTPSEAMNIKNPVGAFATDMILDPTNIVGGSAASKIVKSAKSATKASKVAKVKPVSVNPSVQNIFSKLPTPDWFTNQMRFLSLPELNNPNATKVLENFRERIKTPEGQKRLKDLGITNTKVLDDLTIVGDENTLGKYWMNKIGLNPNLPEVKRVTRHEIEHAVQDAIESSRMNKYKQDADNLKYLFRPKAKKKAIEAAMKPTSEIDDMLGGLELRKTPEKVDWDKIKETGGKREPSELFNYMSDKQRATNYFDSGSGGREKSAFLSEVQQYMMDEGIIPKTSYAEVTPEMVKETFINAMFDEKGGKYLRLFNIMKPNEANYKLVSNALNKMLTVVPVVGGAAAATSQLEQKEKGGKIKKDDTGYWNPENWGEPVEIDSNEITMDGVYEPLLGISDTGDVQMMYPGEDYTFDGETVTEYPMAKSGMSVNNADAQPIKKLDQLLNFTNYNKPTKGGWLDKWAD
jgi:hypothetical protein